jgi:acyl-coenzyme A thioesterase PaaI-like protein
MNDPWTFGVAPLPQTIALAASLRRLTALALSLEGPSDVIDGLLAEVASAEQQLSASVPTDTTPRVGAAADGDGRAYIDHARDIGAFNPCFPEYEITIEGERAWGTVSFPVAYEGPPGLVHGGFLAVFFDSAVQHHNCDVGVAGKTTSLSLRYRRPTPLLTDLRFEVARTVDGPRITSDAQLMRDDKALCEARVEAIAGDRAALPAVSPRRTRT